MNVSVVLRKHTDGNRVNRLLEKEFNGVESVEEVRSIVDHWNENSDFSWYEFVSIDGSPCE